MFDPAVLRNGVHEIRLYAQDLSGNVTVAEGCAIVDGGLKTGQVNMAFEDISLPRQGFPLSLAREYDSRAQGPGDFGPGWNLPSKNVKADVTHPLGEFWTQGAHAGAWGVPTYLMTEERLHYAVIRLGDTDTLRFRMKVSPRTSVLYPFENGHIPMTVSFVPEDGAQGALEALDTDSDVILLQDRLRTLDLEVYNPTRFRLTRPDGAVYVIGPDGIESMTDVHGHSVTYNNQGIHHSSGASISFTRGAGDRIEKVTDQIGREFEYHYSPDGALEKVLQKPGGGGVFEIASRYAYSPRNAPYANAVARPPVLKAIKAPDGAALGSFEYDSKGRVTGLIDGNDCRVIYGYDTPAHKQTVTDRRGYDTVYEYDCKGDVTRKEDPLGNVTEWTYDENGHAVSEILRDEGGDVVTHTTYENDVRGNRLFEHTHIASQGKTLIVGYTYNDRNQVVTVTDPKGNLTTNIYDDKGSLERIEEPEGKITHFTYDSHGNMVTMRIGDGPPTVYDYNPDGTVDKETETSGSVTDYTYWPDGNTKTEKRYRTAEDENGNPVTVTMVTQYEYDTKGRLTRTVDPASEDEITEYDPVTGKQSATVDKNNVRTEYEYDGGGNQEYAGYADGTSEHYTYDEEGNKKTFTDRDGYITGYDYDALGRLTDMYHCGSADTCAAENAVHKTGVEYDAAGRMTARTDENGVRTEYDYDEAGRQTVVRRFFESRVLETVTAYDDNGNRKTVTDPKQHTVTFEYDNLNRLVKTVFHDGTYTEVSYDDQGRREFEYAQAMPGDTDRVVTKYEYDLAGRLTAVINDHGGPDQAVMRYAYDEVGNKISQTDPNLHVTKWSYDDLGRIKKRTLPEGMSESFAYYPGGNVKTETDFNGDTTVYEYHPCCGRLKTKRYQDGALVSYTYTPGGAIDTVTDARGVTDHDYDFRGRLTRTENPGGTAISYTYYPNGSRNTVTTPSETVTYAYDDLNRLETVTAPDSGMTVYTYDDVGNRKTVTLPNGNITEYFYDTLNRLETIENRKSDGTVISSYTYELSPAGNRKNVTESGGRFAEYGYDRLNRLLTEYISDPVNGNESIVYTYDNFGNRKTKTDSSGTVDYVYDDNDRLTFETGPGYTNTYVYDLNGNLVRKNGIIYGFDHENRLISVDDGASFVEYRYDHDGIRVSKSVDGAAANYLADKNRDYAQVLEERDDSGTLTVFYVYGDDLIFQDRGIKQYYLYDGQMSTRQLTDASGDVTDEYVYDAFGILLDQAGVSANNYLYTGEQYDPNAGFYYLRARWMNPATGRFITTDPYQGRMQEPVTLHKYLYANMNPVVFRDPSGLWSLQELNVTQSVKKILRKIKTAKIFKKKIKRRQIWFIIQWGIDGIGTDFPGTRRRVPIHCRVFAEKIGLNSGRLYDIGRIDVGHGLVSQKNASKREAFHAAIIKRPIAKLTTLQFLSWHFKVHAFSGMGELMRVPGMSVSTIDFGNFGKDVWNCCKWSLTASALAFITSKTF